MLVLTWLPCVFLITHRLSPWQQQWSDKYPHSYDFVSFHCPVRWGEGGAVILPLPAPPPLTCLVFKVFFYIPSSVVSLWCLCLFVSITLPIVCTADLYVAMPHKHHPPAMHAPAITVSSVHNREQYKGACVPGCPQSQCNTKQTRVLCAGWIATCREWTFGKVNIDKWTNI